MVVRSTQGYRVIISILRVNRVKPKVGVFWTILNQHQDYMVTIQYVTVIKRKDNTHIDYLSVFNLYFYLTINN